MDSVSPINWTGPAKAEHTTVGAGSQFRFLGSRGGDMLHIVE